MNKLNAIKNYVVENERLIAALVVTSTVCVAYASRKGIAQHVEFLKEHGLYEEFLNIHE
jgi:hypothetical protein